MTVAVKQQTTPDLEAIRTRYSLQTDQEAKPFDISAQLGILRLPAFSQRLWLWGRGQREALSIKSTAVHPVKRCL
jgi:hypothetical protein